jgi:hypothetical protein
MVSFAERFAKLGQTTIAPKVFAKDRLKLEERQGHWLLVKRESRPGWQRGVGESFYPGRSSRGEAQLLHCGANWGRLLS